MPIPFPLVAGDDGGLGFGGAVQGFGLFLRVAACNHARNLGLCHAVHGAGNILHPSFGPDALLYCRPAHTVPLGQIGLARPYFVLGTDGFPIKSCSHRRTPRLACVLPVLSKNFHALVSPLPRASYCAPNHTPKGPFSASIADTRDRSDRTPVADPLFQYSFQNQQPKPRSVRLPRRRTLRRIRAQQWPCALFAQTRRTPGATVSWPHADFSRGPLVHV